MMTNVRGGFHRFTLGLLLAAAICLAGGLLMVMQAQAGGRDPRPAAQAAETPQPGPAYVAGEVLVRLRAGASSSGKRALAGALGAATFRDLGVSAILPRGQRILLYKSATLTGDALVKSALRSPNVIAASLNYSRRVSAVTPNDPHFPALWGLNNTGQTGGAPGADISALEAWSTTTGSSGVVVADIDTGVAYDHPDLAANMWHNPGEVPANGIDDDRNGYVDDVHGINAVNGSGDPYDVGGHGTHTSGTMAAVGNNGVGITGVAWQARIMALQSFDPDGHIYDDDAITCIDYVVDEKLSHGVNVVAINASWGGAGYNDLLRDAIDAAGEAGIVFCAAAGNGGDDGVGDDSDAEPFYPASYDCANIVAVAATDDTDTLADFSNYGATSVDLAAPGVGILSTVPAVGVTFNGVAFVDAVHGWAVGEGGLILATSNGGATWSTQTSGTLATFWGVAFSDATHGWAVGEDGLILATSNGGATWSRQTTGTSELLYDVAFSDAAHGWAVGEGGTILATSDGGATWSTQTSGISTWFHGVAFSDATHGWAVGEGGTILATGNGGATWNKQNSGSSARLYDVAFSDATHAWVVGRDGVILV
ncbi:MAG: S8 family serine peptidase, partial [Actinobacteria bacterium]|nr:S8 family serine peptidase [Actinomycetota bacterium]